ncbi:unnamed protein product [Brassica napus]|uniref:(rape) hypothetical protein n=1 Tax=Brassica napus TaxID=3708 RepID=A0A816WM35_BRANA|nr:unnamed protein product [Brassica napus]
MAMLETNVIIIVILLLLMVLMLFLFSLVILFACKPWRYLPLFRSSSFKLGELQRPLVSDGGDEHLNQGQTGEEGSREYDLEELAIRMKGFCRDGLTNKGFLLRLPISTKCSKLAVLGGHFRSFHWASICCSLREYFQAAIGPWKGSSFWYDIEGP